MRENIVYLWVLKGELRYFLNLDLISGMKYVHLLTENRGLDDAASK